MLFYFNSTYARLILRIFFTVFFLYLGLAGGQCYQLALKLRLLRRNKVIVPDTVGWLRNAAVLTPLWYTRRVPSVGWWLLMVLIALLSTSTDFTTATVRNINLPSLCPFGDGLVVQNGGTNFTSVPWNTRSVTVAGNAQIYSERNSCKQGIYRKANTDVSFCANDADIMGNWTCTPVGDYGYGARWDGRSVANDLVRRGLLYGPLQDSMDTSVGLQNVTYPQWNQLVAWSASIGDGTRAVFNISAAISTTVEKVGPKNMHVMHCIMDAPGICSSTSP